MVKRTLSLLTMIVLLLALFTGFASADEVSENEYIIPLENGCYILVSITEVTSRAANTKTASKTFSFKNEDGTVQWKAVLTGSFTYNGTTATCAASSCDVTIYETDYYVVSKTAGKSGASATASVTMGRKFLGVTIAQDTYDMTLTCDKNGNLS